jgi:putative oxidoreductase
MAIHTYSADAATIGAGLLVGRLVLGLLMAAHGTQKRLGWFGGYGIAGTGGFLETLGFRPGRAFAATAALTEVVGGLLVAAGLLGPVGPALMLSVMIVAGVSVHWKNGIFAATNGIELPLLYGTGALTLALTGPGLFSLDALAGVDAVWTPGLKAAVLAIGVLGGAANLLARRPAPAAATDSPGVTA